MPNISVIRQGESFPFSFDLDGEDIADFICVIEVKQFPSDAAIISRTIEPTGNVWSGFLTSTETAPLDTGVYRLIALITNSTTDEEEQQLERFNVTTAWA